jgi:hypothetical protein
MVTPAEIVEHFEGLRRDRCGKSRHDPALRTLSVETPLGLISNSPGITVPLVVMPLKGLPAQNPRRSGESALPSRRRSAPGRAPTERTRLRKSATKEKRGAWRPAARYGRHGGGEAFEACFLRDFELKRCDNLSQAAEPGNQVASEFVWVVGTRIRRKAQSRHTKTHPHQNR